ncbi:histone deacetylase Rpd3 [Dimargaris cristalligena]|uniref:Histone deacetylase n=1 Tax=Dimargaris cristalligena TaxID=215637 RepID=A0A4Q0A1I2_9FUNG|nr:histone deacetylase Rpd3 [Dimargaris cristalligena]|eukprot:RKP39010.1 histone deacetylase Rpd3 [Dimargaris cristalligena]
MTATKRRVAYYYDNEVGNYTFGPNHVMKPQRMRMVHNLVVNYGMHKHMEIMRPNRATFLQMTQFHTDEYIDFLKTVCAENAKDLHEHTAKYLSGEDCPVWEGIYEFCSISAGGSIAAANKLNHGEADIGINWSGGLHHAKKNEASGFCYVNDNVLGILELLRYHQRVVYIDIDVHHGDGVEEAFYLSDRVMTVSFHKHGDFFPGTGEIRDIGIGKGRNYAVNVPLRDGINDESYKFIFRSVIQNVMDHYRPGAVWLQCGTDSLAGDRLGCFNLSMHGHAACVEFMRSFNVPLVVVGGGGYTIRNVARTWTYETAVCLGIEPDPMLPFHDYYEYYGPDYRLDVPSNNMDNHNDRKFLEKIRNRIADTLRQIPHAPSVQLQSVPRDVSTEDEDEEDEEAMNTDIRISQRQRDAYIFPDNEFADLDDGLARTLPNGSGMPYDDLARTGNSNPSDGPANPSSRG